MYIRSIGFAIMIIGFLFKIMHWPGANMSVLAGGLLVIAGSVVVLLKRPRPLSASAILRAAAGVLTIAVLLMKWLHWPGADAALVAALIAIVALLVVDRGRVDLSGIRNMRRPLLLFTSIALTFPGILFKVMHWPGASILLQFGMIGLAAWFLLSGRQQKKSTVPS